MKKTLLIAGTLTGAILSTPSNAVQTKDFGVSVHPDNQQLIYYSYRGEELPDIFLLDQRTNQETNITQSPDYWDIEPAYSPDGKLIAFSRGEHMGAMHIYVMNADGSHLRKVSSTTAGSNVGANFSPDGKQLVFSNFIGRESSTLYKVDLTSLEQLALTSPSQGMFSIPQWAPDGQRIAALKKTAGKNDIVIMNVNGDNITNISTTPELDEGIIRWSPDANQLIASVGKATGFNQLMAYDVKTKSAPVILTDFGANHSYFSNFSADGKEIYFDLGNWQQDFFIHKAKWSGKAISKPQQVSGLSELASRQAVIDQHLKPLVGKWQGVNSNGRFKEIASYHWGDNKKSLIVDMTYYWDGIESGSAHGTMSVDVGNATVYFNLVMEDGTVVMQQQNNPSSANRWEMDVTTSGQESRFPNHFKTVFTDFTHNSWTSEILWEHNGEWQLKDSHKFTRIQ